MKIHRNGQLLGKVLDISGRVLVVAAAALPLWVLMRGVDSVAGETTTVNMNIAVTLTVALTGVSGVLWRQNRYLRRQLDARDKEIRDLKERLDKPEDG